MKPRRNLYGIHNDFSAVAGGLRRGCILIRNRDGWDDDVPWTCTHTSRRICWGGWGGRDDDVPWTCTHTSRRICWGGWTDLLGGWGGWDDDVPWTCTYRKHAETFPMTHPLMSGTWLDTQDGAKRSESYGAKRSDSDGAKRSSDHLYWLIFLTLPCPLHKSSIIVLFPLHYKHAGFGPRHINWPFSMDDTTSVNMFQSTYFEAFSQPSSSVVNFLGLLHGVRVLLHFHPWRGRLRRSGHRWDSGGTAPWGQRRQHVNTWGLNICENTCWSLIFYLEMKVIFRSVSTKWHNYVTASFDFS